MDAELAAFLDQRFEETKRHFDAVAEGLRGEVLALREKIESAEREILAAIKFSYSEIDRRIRRLEALTADLEVRLDRLEHGP
jgi:hypothetical protein